MIGELDLAGLFVSPLLPCLLIGFVLRIALSRVLDRIGVYRLLGNRPLFDLSLLVMLVGALMVLFPLVWRTSS
ncbi:DUF1656 domain-containing protein [Stenotrophomonas sp. SMYL86]|jgi:hypothetical protein|uniref:DUF1656 domain-containing protein n=1 Tax=Stenotrophomonas maltophilia TaxID=40324 RepID=A0AAI9FSX0_STEMA|nr:DUF1656 domain-containing protein [Stenotrophomonas sp. SMYL86]EKT4089560.1 DUF1656 domain-containing protein [Stenotrophomonas maltophilia]HBP04403.1 DUF1656 domain-containing protein [Stenotrophomonas sp.]EKT4091016.1 DUF1656 domain-containing protein [Stenotrophomonas maltophilia]MBH1655498.1 DUF1656 domain-containing protein [Stenotrophomonas maltophilia]MBH1843584.1 DUF1656 domain-containing protein [Stenotrophomonas maltophilia]